MNSNIQTLEEKLRPNLKWQRIEDVPDLPLSSFDELKRKVSSSELSVGVSIEVVRKLASWIYGQSYAVLSALLWTIPLFVSIFISVIAFISKQYLLLLCWPALLAGYFLSSFFALGGSVLLPLALSLVCAWLAWSGRSTPAWILAAFLLPIWMNKIVTASQQSKARSVVLESEVLFLTLYADGNVGVKDNSMGQTYWCKPAMLEKAHQMMGKASSDDAK